MHGPWYLATASKANKEHELGLAQKVLLQKMANNEDKTKHCLVRERAGGRVGGRVGRRTSWRGLSIAW